MRESSLKNLPSSLEQENIQSALTATTSNSTVPLHAFDLDYQASILPGVSRTFALTIPVLPERLSKVVTNAYLLCRIADTIEDDAALTDRQKTRFHGRFLAVIEGREDAGAFARELAPLLSAGVLPDERDLVRNTASVVRVMRAFSRREREALTRCLAVMCSGMPKFQRNKTLRGLRDLKELGAYCYVVAGVVGEMLTELFCAHCPDLQKNRREMKRLAVSFGQGLQMTNILKDIWEDRRDGTCWLPRSMFAGEGASLYRLEEFHRTGAFRAGMNSLIGVTHRHLQNALEFTCLIPAREAGMRRFCLWALGLAVMTLQKVYRNPHYTSGDQVKVSRRTLQATILATNFTLTSNRCLHSLFRFAASGLPLWRADTVTWMSMVGPETGRDPLTLSRTSASRSPAGTRRSRWRTATAGRPRTP